MHFWTRDKLRSCIKPIKIPAPGADHRVHKGLNNAIEVSHRPTRKREKIFGRFKSHRQAPRFLSAPDHPLVSASSYCWAVIKLPPPRPLRCVQPLGRLHRRNGGITHSLLRCFTIGRQPLDNTNLIEKPAAPTINIARAANSEVLPESN